MTKEEENLVRELQSAPTAEAAREIMIQRGVCNAMLNIGDVIDHSDEPEEK